MSDYMELTEKLLRGLPEDDENIYEVVNDRKEEIIAINDLVVETKIYKENIDKSNEFFNNLAGQYNTNKEMVEAAWKNFLIKIIDAPTTMHMRGAIIFNIPIVKRFLDLGRRLTEPVSTVDAA